MRISAYTSFVTLQEKNMPFYVASIGHAHFQTIVHRPSGIDDCQILYTLGGTGCCFASGKEYELTRGYVYFLPMNSAHEYHAVTSNWETLYITFNGGGVKNFFDFEPAVFKITDSFDFEKRHAYLAALKENPDCVKDASVELYKLLLDLKEGTVFTTEAARRKKDMLTGVLHTMTENSNVNLSDIVSMLNISEEHFCRIFKDYTGFRPFEYINRLKIQKAKELLKNSELNIKDISYQTGFENHSYFSKLFKRYTGCTPSEYRANR